MKIQRLDLTIRDLAAGWLDDGEGGVVGYGGWLDIRPTPAMFSKPGGRRARPPRWF